MADFIGLENELNTKGTKIVYEVKHNQQSLSFTYDNVTEEKVVMDGIVMSYLTNFNVSCSLENSVYKGDATII